MQKLRLHLLWMMVLAVPCYANLGHSKQGTDYSAAGAANYATFKHGKDGALFLDPYFIPFLTDMKNQVVLDAGCGAGPWAIQAAKNGARVYGIDIQNAMIERAKNNAAQEGIDTIEFLVGSVGQLPYAENLFDKALSINVGCNLPQDVFAAHFTELFRTLKKGGKVIITAPAKFEVVFADGDQFNKQEIYDAIKNTGSSAQDIVSSLSVLKPILRATFVVRNNKLKLVEDEKELVEGEAIWRKIPGLVVPNFYHAENSYISQLIKAGFVIDRVDQPRFPSRKAWMESASRLSQEYSYYHPFVIFHASKP